jgi:hypothetical protein
VDILSFSKISLTQGTFISDSTPQFVRSNASIPDVYVWHLEGNSADVNDDLQTNMANLNPMLSAAGLPTNPAINIDEYGNVNEQVPAGAAWWISRLERYNARGLRGNWLGGAALHDFMASLLGKPNAGTGSYNPTAGGYWPNGEYQVVSSLVVANRWLTSTILRCTR